ncbi:MAG: VCBS repeat-containing protein [Planctomycetes bacterium]|nr:VCBS repeat-containing protein [Planctomycetota bacterium]
MFAAPAFADDAASRDEPPPDRPSSLAEIKEATDIAPGAAEFELLPLAAQVLLLERPDVEAAVVDGRVAAFYGGPLAAGATPEEAERAFWASYGDAFGVDRLELRPTRTHEVGFGRFHVFAYQQQLDGVPVEFATFRLLTDSTHANAVVFVSGRVAELPAGGCSEVLIAPDTAVGIVAASAPFSYFRNWSTPELVVFAGVPEEWGSLHAGSAVKTWKLQADFQGEQTPFQAVTFYVDAATGELAHVTRDTVNIDLTGHVRARATSTVRLNQQTQQLEPWTGPYDPGDPDSLNDQIAVPDILLRVSPGGTPSSYSDTNGDFGIAWSGGSTTVTTTVDEAHWFDIDPPVGVPLVTDSETVVPGFPADFFLNELNVTRESTAQMNGLIYAAQVRKFFTDRMTFPALDYRLRVLTSDPGGGCNAYYARDRLVFYAAGTSETGYFCNDCCFSAVVAHEYGHFVHGQLGVFGDAFAEGFGDACALLLFDDTIINRGFEVPRDYSPGAPEVTYPYVGSEPHGGGMVLGGLWRDIREQLSTRYYSTAPLTDATALAFARDLFVDWAQITNGGYGTQSAHPLTIREIYSAAQSLSDEYGIDFVTDIKPRICEAAFQHGLALHALPGPICAAKNPQIGQGPFVSFRPAQITYANAGGVNRGINPYGIAVGKVDGDTLNDVVLACELSPTSSTTGVVLVYWGAGQSPSSYSFDPAPTSIPVQQDGRATKLALADFDNDGLNDIVVTLAGTSGFGLNQVQILRNDGNRGFTALSPLNPVDDQMRPILRPTGVATGDWDNNGYADIAIAGYVDDAGTDRPTLGLFWNSGGFVFFPVTGITAVEPNSPQPPADPIYSSGRAFDLCAWSEDASGGYGSTYNMLAMTNGVMSRHYYFRGAMGSQSLARFGLAGFASQSLTPIDVNGDSLVDVASAMTPGAATSWFPRLTAASFDVYQASDLAGTGTDQRSVASGKITKTIVSGGILAADARADFVIATIPSGFGGQPIYEWSISVFPTTGTSIPHWPSQYLLAVSPNPFDRPFPRQVLVTDINGDGLDDVLTANRGLASSTAADEYEGFSLRLNRGQ